MNHSKLFVAFHVPADEGQNKRSLIQLARTLKDVFDEDSYRKVSTQRNEDTVEVVYCFERPLMKDSTEDRRFFEGMDTVFNVEGELFPHFTQMTVDTTRGI